MSSSTPREDPHFRRTLKEARLILVILAVTTAVVLWICFSTGYRADVGVRATRDGIVTVVTRPDGSREVRITRTSASAPAPGNPPETGETYEVAPAFELKVHDAQQIARNTLLAGPPFDPASLPMVAGFPAWVFWGILVPKAICVMLTIWFALVFAKDHPWATPPEAPPESPPEATPNGQAGNSPEARDA